MENKFKDDDKEKVIEFLNFIAEKAVFNGLKVQDNIKFFRLLNHMQTQILPKIEANILEIKKITEAPKEEPKKKATKASKGNE
jgi:ABC-type uncharacterized transport system ATPase subunit